MGNFNRSDRFSPRRSFGDRRMYKAICSKCGKDCEVPFRPSDRPVFCNDCFRNNRDSGRQDDRNFVRPRSSERKDESPNYQEQFDTLNRKIDKILSLLTSVVPTEEITPTFKDKIEKEVASLNVGEVVPAEKKKRSLKNPPPITSH